MVQHVNITDPNIHEPKGISNASQGEVYVANGAGSGSWENLTESNANYFEGYSHNSTPSTSSIAVSNIQLAAGRGFINSTNRVVCTSTEAKYYLVTATVQCDTLTQDGSGGTTSGVASFYIAKNGVAIGSSKKTVSSAESVSTNVCCVVELQNQDEISVRVSGVYTISSIAYSIFGN